MKRFLLTAIFAVLGTYVFAQQKPVVAVAPFEVISGISTADANALTGVFYNRLGNANVVTLVDRSVVERVIREHQFQLEDDWSNARKTAEIGEALNADWIVRGRIESYRSNIIINVQFYDINTFQFRGGDDISLSNADEAYEKMTSLVNSLVATIAGGKTAQPIPEGLLYEIVDGKTVALIEYVGNAATLTIPERIQGLPVTAIHGHEKGAGGFISDWRDSSLTSITIPFSVTFINLSAIPFGLSLTSITVDNRNPNYASIDGVLFDKNIRTLISCPASRRPETYVIPSSVTTIGDGAFWGYSKLTSVTIPSSVTSIGDSAFCECSSLTSVTIPSSVTSIGFGAFWGCSSLTSVAIPSSVTSIGDRAFSECSSLTSITIPSSVTEIGWSAFEGCESLTSITIPSSVTTINEFAFRGCSNLTSVTLSRRTRVDESAFDQRARITYRD